MTRAAQLAAGLVGAAVLGAAPTASAEDARPTLRVFAAASLTEVVEALAKGYGAARVIPSFGASSELARQIGDGAPADVFISASLEWIAFLRETNALDGEPVAIARNSLVCVAPRGSELAGQVADPDALLARLAAGERVGIADAGVPAGEYAREVLTRAGVLEAFERLLVGQRDVRAVLHAVEQGELAAGFVYGTDARVAAVETLFAFDPASHPPIEYAAAALRAAASPAEARRFLAHLQGAQARALLREAGFALP